MDKPIEEIAAEILRLKDNPYVRIAKQEAALRNILLENLHLLRKQEAKGKEIASSSATMELIACVEAELNA